MSTVHINASVSYDMRIGAGILPTLGETVQLVCPRAMRYVLVTDDVVEPLWARPVTESLEKASLTGQVFTFPHGETSKNVQTLVELLNFIAKAKLTRSDILLALGGGVVGDLTGLAAAVYMRGLDYIQIPTSLLAAVDSSVGGKTAVDLPAGKNLMGAFWQPRHVLFDTATLATLPEAEFISGCAEVIKTAVLFDEELFQLLERDVKSFDRESVIARCVAYKRDVVAKDERDTGLRALLNFGHTLGHAIEACSNYTLTHGQSVAIGIAAISRAAAHNGLCDRQVPKRICALLHAFGLPTRTDIPLDELMDKMLSDKKRTGSVVRVVIPERIGKCSVRPMGTDALYTFMEAGLLS